MAVTFAAAFPPTMTVTVFSHLDTYLGQGDWVYRYRRMARLFTYGDGRSTNQHHCRGARECEVSHPVILLQRE